LVEYGRSPNKSNTSGTSKSAKDPPRHGDRTQILVQPNIA
jgi:hypothetical protein